MRDRRIANVSMGALSMCLCMALAACQGTAGVVESLDARSGLTIVTDREAAVFARTRAQISRSARDYVYLGPVEVNERGVREYFLWLGFASTIDRAFAADTRFEPEQLIIDLEGAPIEFELQAWGQRLPRLDGRKIYDSVVTPAAVFAARVTLDQINRIAAGGVSSVTVVVAGAPDVEYFLWQEPGFAWSEFARYAGVRLR